METIIKKSLKDFIKLAEEYGYDDYWAIKTYIIENDLESRYIKMIVELSESKINELDYQIRQHQWLAYPSDQLYKMCYRKKIDPEIAKLLDLAQRYTILNIPIDTIVEKLKGKTDNIDIPNPFYMPALKNLIKLGIKFKDSDRLVE